LGRGIPFGIDFRMRRDLGGKAMVLSLLEGGRAFCIGFGTMTELGGGSRP